MSGTAAVAVRWRAVSTWRRAVIAFAAVSFAGVAPASASSEGLSVIAHHDLGGHGGHVAVAASGVTAFVVSDGAPPCGPAAITVVDLKKPRRPQVVGTTPVPLPGPVASVAAEEGLVAVATKGCPGQGGGVSYYRQGALVGTSPLGSIAAVALASGADGRTLAAIAWEAQARVEVQDVTDPAAAQLVGRGSAPGGAPVDVAFHDRNRGLVVLMGDGRLYDIPVEGPNLQASRDLGASARGSYVTALPLADRTVAIVSQPDALRIVDLHPTGGAADESPAIRSADEAVPGKAVGSGDYAFTPWHADGLQVIDLGAAKPQTLAAFKPSGGDIVGVALLPEHILALDEDAGLYVLGRPSEGGGGTAWWQNGNVFFAALALAALAVLLAAPRAARMLAAAGAAARAPAPSAQRVRSRGGRSPRRRR